MEERVGTWGALALFACSVPAAQVAQKTGATQSPAARAEQGVPDAVRRALLAADWERALAELGKLEQERPQVADWWLYLQGTTWLHAKNPTAAIGAFEQVEAREPASAWRHKARFAHAEALQALGRAKEAETIYEEEAQRLFSQNRQEELAAIYLGFADTLSTPAVIASAEPQALDYERAVVLYQRALELDVSAATRERARYRILLCREAQGRRPDVIAAAHAYRDEFDPTVKAANAVGEHLFDVMQRQAGALARADDSAAARRAFEDLSAAIAAAREGKAPWTQWRETASEPALLALRALDGDAQFAIAGTYAQGSDSVALATAALARFVAAFPEHERNPQAAFDIGVRFQMANREEDAIRAFDEFLARPAPVTNDAARLEAFTILRMSALYRKGEVLVRQRRFEDAIAAFREYGERYPIGPDWARAQLAIVDAEYEIGLALRERGELEAARTAWTAFLTRYPLDKRAQTIQIDLAGLYVRRADQLRRAAEAEHREPARAELEQLFRDAIAQWRRVVSMSPHSEAASTALFRIGDLQERELHDLAAAVAAYRECDFGSCKSDAAASLSRMTEPSLVLLTERVWRTGETPRIKVQVRNLEELQVELYTLDLESYFRKNLSHLEVENLDLDLIAADRQFAHPVAGYAKYQAIEQDLDLPVQGPGVWAVVVTSGKFRATTLVIASDLDVLVRSSADEALVFVEDLPRGAAAAGVRVLLAGLDSSGGPHIREVVTGDDGTASATLEGIGKASDLRVLALRDGHVATNSSAKMRAVAASWLAPRGLAYTDRPVYRPGETVHWRAILRDVTSRRLTFEPGKSVEASIEDSRSQTVWSGEVPLSKFGTVNGELALDAKAHTGTYRVQCKLFGNAVTSTFEVQEFQPPKVELTLETPRDVYFRGERVDVTARATYYWGEPVANSPLHVVLPDSREIDLVTGADGTARLEFDTRDFASEQTLEFKAVLTEEQAPASAKVFLALREFKATLSTAETTYLAGASFDVMVETFGADGEPIAAAMSLAVMRRRSTDDGGWSERLTSTHQLATNADDGTAHLSLSLPEGGAYLLRAHGEDRFGNPVDAERALFISGEDDPQRLRFVVATHQLKVGEQASFELVNRADAGLALVTIESDTILEHRVVSLAKGSNKVALAIDHIHFPNFVVAAAMMRPGELLSDSTAFDVSRGLVVKIEPERKLVRPGEEVAVKLTAVDQLGRPVEAELSLAVYDEALLALFPDKTESIRKVFESKTQRAGNFTTTASCTFTYQGVTRKIADALVAEAERKRELERWREERAETLKTLGEIASVAGEPGWPAADATVASIEPVGHYGTGTPSAWVSRRAGGGAKEFEGLGQGGGGGRGGRRSSEAAAAQPYRPVAENPPEFVFWSPSVVTDAKGEARVVFALPQVSTRWHLVSRGIDTGVLVGESTASLVSKDEFFVELRTPVALVEGDAPRLVARLHNLTGMKGKARLSLRATSGERTQTYPIDVELGDAPEVECTFPALDPASPVSALAVSVEAVGELNGIAHDGTVAATIAVRPYRPTSGASASLPVRPWGVEFADSRSGVLRRKTDVALELDPVRRYGTRSLELTFGPSVDSLLANAALGGESSAWSSGGDATAAAASELLGVSAMIDLILRSGQKDHPELARLTARSHALTARIVGAQASAGHWAWMSDTDAAHPETSCIAMIALAAAGERDAVPARTLERGRQYLASAFQSTSQQADEIKALLSWALTVHGQGDFGALNRLHRRRATLSPAALSYTALALAQMDRAPMALEVAEALEARVTEIRDADGERTCRCDVTGNGAWMRSSVEMTALAAMALERAKPGSSKLAPAIEFVLTHRPWHGGRARGLAVAAIARFRSATEPATQRVRVTARIGDSALRTIDLSSDSPAETIHIELAPTSAGKVAIELTLEGRGAPHFMAVLRGFSADLAKPEAPFSVESHEYLAPLPRYRGADLGIGFGVLQEWPTTWQNTVAELGHGAMTICRVMAHSRADLEHLGGDSDYLIVEIPLPAGARLLEGSVHGDRVRLVEQRNGSLFVHLGQIWSADDSPPSGTSSLSWGIEYTLLGAVPGAYRALPVVVRSLYEPERMAIGDAKALTVLARGEASHDVYRPTPDETFNRGLALFAAGEHEAARELLQRLLDEFEAKLREDKLSDVARVLLFANIERNSPRDIVRYFEILKERDAELYIPFDKVQAVGAAYRDIDEHERALSIFRATIDETFGKELHVLQTLDEQREFDVSINTLARLCGEYPDSARVVEASLSLADKLLALAPRAHEEPSLSSKGRSRASLTFDGILELQRFLALHPRDPRAPEAGLNLVTAHLGLADFATASILGEELASAYTEPRFADAFQYSRAVAEWYLGHDDDAMKLLSAIAKAEYKSAAGRETLSPNRDLAHYILAQMHHTRQEFDAAITYYGLVAEQFPDARDTLFNLREKYIAIPEVTDARPKGAVEVELSHRNVAQAELLVYPVDLMTLYLREKNLSKITDVNLSGIAPVIRKSVALETKAGMRTAHTKVALSLADPGAYLVICRSDELHASGLVLISGLELEVKEDEHSGRMRVQVLDRDTGRFVRDVDVRVIGTENDDFAAGRTDPRGLFTGYGIAGHATVIARLGERQYAFHRGTSEVGTDEKETGNPMPAASGATYFKNVLEFNDQAQSERDKSLQHEIRRERKGVQIRQVK